MSLRPVIFISAVSKELASARQAVANALIQLGYTPNWQEVFATSDGDLLDGIRKKVDASSAVIHLIGNCYGSGSVEGERPMSYTQYEAHYARSRGKRVYVFLLDELFPVDPHQQEPPELAQMQRRYRRATLEGENVFSTAGSLGELENRVLRLRDDLSRLRRHTLRWAIALTALVFLIAVGVGTILTLQSRSGKRAHRLEENMKRLLARDAELMAALRAFPFALGRVVQSGETDGIESSFAAARSSIEEKLQMPDGSLQNELEPFAARVMEMADASPIDRSIALLVLGRLEEASRTALEASGEHAKASANLSELIVALRGSEPLPEPDFIRLDRSRPDERQGHISGRAQCSQE